MMDLVDSELNGTKQQSHRHFLIRLMRCSAKAIGVLSLVGLAARVVRRTPRKKDCTSVSTNLCYYGFDQCCLQKVRSLVVCKFKDFHSLFEPVSPHGQDKYNSIPLQ